MECYPDTYTDVDSDSDAATNAYGAKSIGTRAYQYSNPYS
jgi:hypothetical protein